MSHEGVASVYNATSQHPDLSVWLVLICETHVYFRYTFVTTMVNKYGVSHTFLFWEEI